MKEFLPRTMLDDVISEAELLSQFCHPHLPHCFGICISVCAQLAEALRYLHFEVELLHDDIKPDNILLSSDTYRKSNCDSNEEAMHVVLTDFGEATSIHHGRRFYLTPIDQSDYNSHQSYLW